MPRGLRHVALSISLLSPMARRPEALLAMNIASLIFRPDLGFLALTSFQSFKRPSLSFGSSSRISLRRQSFSVSRPRLRPPGNIHNRSRLLLTNKIRPRLAATSFDDFAIAIPHRPNIESFARFNKMILEGNKWALPNWRMLAVSVAFCRTFS
jgi:hypothetical protein